MTRLAGCIIKDKHSRILLLHRNNAKHIQWEIPGGKVAAGETLKQAAVREIKEELGVEVLVTSKIGEKEFVQDNESKSYCWFSATVKAGQPELREPETFDDLRYFSASEMRHIYDQLSPNAQNFLAVIEGNTR